MIKLEQAKREIRRFGAACAEYGIALAVGIAVAATAGVGYGNWFASPENPPFNQVPEPINTGALEQTKVGDLGLADAWVQNTGAWISEQWQFRLFTPAELNAFPSPFFPVPIQPGVVSPDPYATWRTEQISTFGSIGAPFTPPPGNVRRLVKAFVIKVVCWDGYLWITGENSPGAAPNYSSTGTPPWAGDARLACAEASNARDVNTVVVPIESQVFGTGTSYLTSTITYRYHVDGTGPNGGGTFKNFPIGFYYQDVPFTPPESP